jgi:hypothetical protein
MDAHSQVEVLRLHCEYLRSLIDEVIIELITIKRALATTENPSSTLVGPYLNGLEKQSEHLATETVRLQGFLQSLGLQNTDASEAAGESH